MRAVGKLHLLLLCQLSSLELVLPRECEIDEVAASSAVNQECGRSTAEEALQLR
jgi:hypothetical protein